jgi:hypothetical protein
MWPKKKQSQACEREQKTFVLNKDAKGGFEYTWPALNKTFFHSL